MQIIGARIGLALGSGFGARVLLIYSNRYTFWFKWQPFGAMTPRFGASDTRFGARVLQIQPGEHVFQIKLQLFGARVCSGLSCFRILTLSFEVLKGPQLKQLSLDKWAKLFSRGQSTFLAKVPISGQRWVPAKKTQGCLDVEVEYQSQWKWGQQNIEHAAIVGNQKS